MKPSGEVIGFVDEGFDPTVAWQQAIRRQVDFEDRQWEAMQRRVEVPHYVLKKERFTFAFRLPLFRRLRSRLIA